MAIADNEQFTTDAAMTGVAIAYTNPAYALIADEVMPRVPVAAEQFRWLSYPLEEGFTVPDTRVGKRSAPNRAEIGGKDETSSTEDYGIDVPLDNDSIRAAERRGHDPRLRATARAMGIVTLGREMRVAAKLQDTANYDADLTTALSGTDQFDHADSNPIDLVLEYLDACLMRPNQLVFGHDAWRKFRQNRHVVKAVHGNSGDAGVASRAQVADLLEVPRIHVGASRVNVNRPGQAVELAPALGATRSRVNTSTPRPIPMAASPGASQHSTTSASPAR